MVTKKPSAFLLYRWRYVIAYGLFSVVLATLLVVAGFYLPGGLTNNEIRSALISDGLNPATLLSLKPEELIYLPYRLLQAASIGILGFSAISIKLASIILGFIGALSLLYLLNLWYRRNVAIFTAIIAVTTNQFLVSSQAGQAGIIYITLTSLILVAASMIARRSAYANVWVIIGFILAGLSLYMPLNVYILVAIAVTAIVHPHARHLLIRESSKLVLAIGVLLFGIIITPLVLGIVREPSLILTLLGVPTQWSGVLGSAGELLREYTLFYQPRSGATMVPIYGLGIVLLALVGIYRLLTEKYTTKSYIISFWLALLVPLIFINPAFISITFLPIVLLLALGIDYLIISWYKLFPHNPYARVFGLLPLSVLIGGIIISSVDRYVYGFHYDSAVYADFDFDLATLSSKLSSLPPESSVTLVVPESRVEYFDRYATHQKHIEKVHVTSDARSVADKDIVLVERSMKDQISAVPSEVIVSRTSKNADRFYLYK